jgi:hypothetical protein
VLDPIASSRPRASSPVSRTEQGSVCASSSRFDLFFVAIDSNATGAIDLLHELERIHHKHEEQSEIRRLEQENASLQRSLARREHEMEFVELENAVLRQMGPSGALPPKGS